MLSQWKPALIGGSAILALSGDAIAQTAPQPPVGPSSSAAGSAPVYDPQQLPVQRGQVQQFTLTPRGDIDGFILTDGTEVKTPPHLSTQIAYAIRLGDMVTIHGLHATALPLVEAVSVTDDATGRTVVDDGPRRAPPPPPPAAAPPGQAWGASKSVPGLTEAQGRVRMALHGPQGDADGALLDDGMILRLPPPEAYRFANLLQPGETVVAEGSELATPMGRVMDVWQIGATRKQLSLVEGPPGPGPRWPPPPPAPGFGPSGPPRP
jgi:hypothetical protein